MNRNDYDTDVTVWSPEGRLFQVEYARMAVTQGSAVVGIIAGNGKVAVLAALKRRAGELSSYQPKLFRIDDHIGIGISGLTADARSLTRYMRTECLNHKYVYGTPLSSEDLVVDVADKHQRCTQSYVRRPYGVGLLISSYDKSSGAHLYRTDPGGNFYEYKAFAIGSRSQAAKTYLERELASLGGATVEEAIHHALKALSGCTDPDTELDAANTSVSVVGEGIAFHLLAEKDVSTYLTNLGGSLSAGAAAGTSDETAEVTME